MKDDCRLIDADVSAVVHEESVNLQHEEHCEDGGEREAGQVYDIWVYRFRAIAHHRLDTDLEGVQLKQTEENDANDENSEKAWDVCEDVLAIDTHGSLLISLASVGRGQIAFEVFGRGHSRP